MYRDVTLLPLAYFRFMVAKLPLAPLRKPCRGLTQRRCGQSCCSE